MSGHALATWEFAIVIKAPLPGSWCCRPEGRLCYVGFLPNLAHQNGLLSTLVTYLWHRIRWAREFALKLHDV